MPSRVQQNSIPLRKISDFINKYKGQKIIIFGFTSLIYQNFLLKLIELKKKFNLKKGIVIHGGGWKKLSSLGLSNKEFKFKLKKLF